MTLLYFGVGLGIIRKNYVQIVSCFFGLTGPSAFLVLAGKMAIYRISPTLSRKLRNIVHRVVLRIKCICQILKKKLNI